MAGVRRLRQNRGWAWTVVVNHVSHLDPMTLGWFLYEHGRLVRYLTKDALFRTPVLKHIVRDAGQIPVTRMSERAATAFDAAVDAVEAGECIGIHPEGTITKDPTGWPMRGKTGAARIAPATGCPVIAIGQWGAQELLPAYSARPHPFPRRVTSYKVGVPVDLGDLADRPVTGEVLRVATDRIMAAITELVEDLRGEQAPAVRFDPRKSGVTEIGNPRRTQGGDR